jgi:hypothetical protein
MSVYKFSQEYIEKQLIDLPTEEGKAEGRFSLDVLALLVGPTSCSKAQLLVMNMLAVTTHKELATAMKEAADRYLRSIPK